MRIKGLPVPVILLLIFPSAGFSSYRIELKNGSEWITNRYQESAISIQFQTVGGLLTLPNSLIRSIEESDRPYVEEPRNRYRRTEPADISNLSTGNAPEIAPLPGDKGSVETPATEDRRLDLEYYTRKNEQLKERLDAALTQIRVSARNNDLEGKEDAQTTARKISRSIQALSYEFKELNGFLPKDWWQDKDGAQ